MASAVTGRPQQLGHIALRVRDVARSAAFYSQVLGLDIKRQGDRFAFLGIREDASHELALFPLGPDAPGPEDGRVGMYHMAWEMASFEDVKALNERLIAAGADIAGYSDRQCNVMFRDPDGNENEAIWEPSDDEVARMGGQVPTLTRPG
jgi:catechol-2,3-dioxygenase